MGSFSNVGISRTDSSVPSGCPVSDLVFIHVLHNKKKKELWSKMFRQIRIPTMYCDNFKN